MSFALWIGRHKVYTATGIAEYFDLASVRGYFLGGTLTDWLRENGGKEYAYKLDMIPKDSPTLNEDIAAVFGVKEIPESVMNGKGCSFCGSGSFYGSYHGSGKLCFGFGSFYEWEELLKRLGSLGSFRFGSGSGKFHEWEWEWLLGRLGSFGSFRFGSGSGKFHEWEWEWLLGQIGSFGSFKGGSFGSRYLLGKSGSFLGSGRLIDFFEGCSFDDYDLIMLSNLIKCPLNGYGYGIHNI